MPVRVAVIGTGPSGLGQLQAFESARQKGADIPEVVCFEKQDDWGGLWNYTWRTGLDEHGEPVHGSMYRHLWSNGPKECLEFADYTFDDHFGAVIPSFPPREVLYDYIIGRADKNNLRKYIEFGTAVRWVEATDSGDKFAVTVEKLSDQQTRTEEFDYVIVATGHFSIPNVPGFEGFARFPGRVLHAHDFRDAREFSGKDLLVMGSSYSAEDIALQCHKYGAKSVTITYRTKPMGFKWPESVDELPLLTRVDGKSAHFRDGTSRDVDAIILGTGYLHSFPFLEHHLRLRTWNRLYPPGLYKGVVWERNPRVMYLGMQDQYYTFNMFDAQAWYARDVVLGQIALPSNQEMADDIAAWVAREESLGDPLEDIDFQTDYIQDLCKDVDYPSFDLELVRAHFKKWEHDKEENIMTYRHEGFASPCTGTQAPPLRSPWLKAMDDSMDTFIKEEAAQRREPA